MKKRTAQFSPNSDGPINKQGRNTSGSTIYQTPRQVTSTPVVPPILPAKSNEKAEEVPRNRFEETIQDQLHCSMNSIPDVTNIYSSPSIGYVVIEVFQRNGLPFDELLPRDSIKKIWTQLGRDLNDVKIISDVRFSNKYLKLTFNLRAGLTLSIAELTNSFETTIDIQTGNIYEVYGIRFPQFRELVCQLGQRVPVTFKKVPPEISCTDLRLWLGLFGEVEGTFRYTAETF
jgi:hypothetical protein